MQLLILIIATFLFLLLVEKLLRKWFRAEKAEFLDSPAKEINQRGEGIIFTIALCFLPFVFVIENPIWILCFFAGHYVVSNGFQAYMQWKYANGAREHLVTLSLIPLWIAALLALAFFVGRF